MSQQNEMLRRERSAQYEIRYEENGHYTEERFKLKRFATARIKNLWRKGIEAELWVVNY